MYQWIPPSSPVTGSSPPRTAVSVPPPSHPSSLLELPRRPVSTRGEGGRTEAGGFTGAAQRETRSPPACSSSIVMETTAYGAKEATM